MAHSSSPPTWVSETWEGSPDRRDSCGSAGEDGCGSVGEGRAATSKLQGRRSEVMLVSTEPGGRGLLTSAVLVQGLLHLAVHSP